MPRFFFHVHDGQDQRDEEGTELANAGEARNQALKLLGALLEESAEHGWSSKWWHVTVTNDVGSSLFEVRVDAISGSGRGALPEPANQP